jgi:hypothetical protein
MSKLRPRGSLKLSFNEASNPNENENVKTEGPLKQFLRKKLKTSYFSPRALKKPAKTTF